MIAVVSVKGQVVIPAELRKTCGITTGTKLVIEGDATRIIMRPITPDIISSLRGSIPKKGATQALLDERKRDRERENKRL